MKPLIVANWKMNPQNSREAFDLAKAVVFGVEEKEVDVVLCVPYIYISQLLPTAKVTLGAQDCFWEEEGAFTGEISCRMLKNLGCAYVILGHSERKKYFGETLEMINKKVRASLQVQLIPIVCVSQDILAELPKVLKGVTKEDMNHLVLCYEPAWAISSSKNSRPATREQERNALLQMRNILREKFGDNIAENTTILYGGSVESRNIREFLGEEGAQGVLVGAASLKAEEFMNLVYGALL